MAKQPIRIGARGSKLSLVQAESVRAAIARSLGADEAAVVVTFTTTGDRIQDRTLAEIGGKGLFTREIEEALADGRIDCAVHSLKDMPALDPPGLIIAASPEREDPRDAFVSAGYDSLAALPKGARLGTASLRRAAQALNRRPDLQVLAVRGNVDTRLAKLARGEADALILAAAGLRRLGLADQIRALVDPRQSPPAPGQGALAIQCRAEDADAAWLADLRHAPTMLATAAERGALAALDGSCRTAVGAYAEVAERRLRLHIEALSPDGRKSFSGDEEIDAADGEAAARDLGLTLGRSIAAQAGEALTAQA
jgi:hydroxymethylbilane synthase